MIVGLGVVVGLGAVLYGLNWLAPERTEADLQRIALERGQRVAERFRHMELQRRYTLAVGRVILPLAMVALAISIVVKLL